MDTRIKEALVTEIKQLVAQKNEVVVQGLGTFSVEHKQQQQITDDTGRIMLSPPEDVIKFVPEKK